MSAVSRTSLASSLVNSAKQVFTSSRVAAANALMRNAEGIRHCKTTGVNPESCLLQMANQYRRQGDLIQTAALSAQSAMMAAKVALSDAENAEKLLDRDSLIKSLKTAEMVLQTAKMALDFAE